MKNVPIIGDLADTIYEAAFVPDLWPSVLQSLSDLSNSASGSLIVFEDRMAPQFVATDRIRPVLEAFDARNGWQDSSEVQLMFSMIAPAAFVYDRDYFPVSAVEANRARLDLTEPLGIGGQIGSFISMPTGETVLFSLDRWLLNDRPSEGEISRLNDMRPHLARAGLIAARLRLQRAQAAVSALQALGLPAAIMTRNNRVIASNTLLEMQQEILISTAFEGLAVVESNANGLFQSALASPQSGTVVRSIPVPATEGRPACIIHVLPLYRSARDVFGLADVIVAVTAIEQKGSPPLASILTTLFDLSPAEAKLASKLALGVALTEAAAVSDIKIKTARTYLERIFRKTGTNRQAELVALLRSTAPL